MKFPYARSRPRVLLTGATGRVARRVTPPLEETCDLIFSDRTAPPGEEARYRTADILQFDEVLSVMEGVEAVVHLAIASERDLQERTAPNGLNAYEEMCLKVNVAGSYHVYEAARRAGIKKFVYISSLTTVMGAWMPENHEDWARYHFDARTPPAPRNHYACTKLYGENLGQVYSRVHGMSVICLRIGQPHPIGYKDGGWEKNKKSRGLVIAVEDVAEAIVCALDTDIPYGVYNLVSRSDCQVVDLSPAREIGYSPRAYFSDAGLTFSEPDGKG